METVSHRAPTRNNTEQNLRSELVALKARYDGGAVSPAILFAIKEIETDLGWLLHRGRP
jgi:hypothetical protein